MNCTNISRLMLIIKDCKGCRSKYTALILTSHVAIYLASHVVIAKQRLKKGRAQTRLEKRNGTVTESFRSINGFVNSF